MRICERGINWFQIHNANGDVRQCSWVYNGHIGNLLEQTVEEVYHSDEAEAIRNRLANNDYSICDIDACPYLAMNDLESHMLEIDHVPQHPTELYLGFEQICNYACTCCGVHKYMMENKDKNLEEQYRKIKERIMPILPYIKKISANGCGELFCSKNILDILANWKPVSAPEEIEVFLESNGSLFDEEHWKQIDNLGKYNVKVAISVMSFDEPVYQYLSGTKMPISRVENNLKFIKSLREKEIVNYFEIATVVQEQNFRSMPEFVRKCLDEYDPDYIRLRPYESWGRQTPEEVWITDVRNPKHPYYCEYKKVMSNPILKHPKVHDWSGGLDSNSTVVFPYKLDHIKFGIISEITGDTQRIISQILKFAEGNRKVIVYGIAAIGKILCDKLIENGFEILYVIDRKNASESYRGLKIINIENTANVAQNELVIITPLIYDKEIFDNLRKNGYSKIMSIKELMSNKKLQEEIKGIADERKN